MPVLVVFAPDVETALADITLIGSAVGRDEEAAKRSRPRSRRSFDQVAAATEGLPKPRVYYELDASNGFFGPAPDYFGTEMIKIAGGDPLTSGTDGVYQLEEEKILAFDPEVILLGDAAYGVTPEQVAARPGWDTLTAVKNGDVRPIDDVIVTRPGPRLGEGIRALATAIHPDLVAALGGALTMPAAPAMTTTAAPAGAPGRLAIGVSVRRVTRTGWLVVAGFVVLVLVFVAGIVLGSVDLPPATTIGIIANRLGFDVPVTWPPTSEAIVMDLRLPRVLTAMVVGTGLAVAGATFQGLLRNPLADPYVLGTASGAALGAAIAVIIPARGLFLQFGLINALAFVGRAAVGDRRLPAVPEERARAADLAAAHGLRRGLAAGRGPRDGDVPLGHGAAPDLRLPARRLRRHLVGAAGRRRCR